MDRFRELMLKAEDGIEFKVLEESGKIVICAVKNEYGDYTNPPIPEGYRHVCGEWNNGFVIERFSDKSQFVWIPVGCLKSNGTVDGALFNEKFGRRKYPGRNDVSKCKSNDGKNFEKRIASVKKYGGFYISRYDITKNKKTGEIQSVKSQEVFRASYYWALRYAREFEKNDSIDSHLLLGSEYDSVLEWFKESCEFDIENNSKWIEEQSINRILNFAGYESKITAERQNDFFVIIRGTKFDKEKEYNATTRFAGTVYSESEYCFRIALCVE